MQTGDLVYINSDIKADSDAEFRLLRMVISTTAFVILSMSITGIFYDASQWPSTLIIIILFVCYHAFLKQKLVSKDKKTFEVFQNCIIIFPEELTMPLRKLKSVRIIEKWFGNQDVCFEFSDEVYIFILRDCQNILGKIGGALGLFSFNFSSAMEYIGLEQVERGEVIPIKGVKKCSHCFVNPIFREW